MVLIMNVFPCDNLAKSVTERSERSFINNQKVSSRPANPSPGRPISMSWTVYNRYGNRKYLTGTEMDLFIRSARRRSVDVQTFCCMIALTGCRISEALEMTADCIDFEAKNVIIRCLKKRGKQVFRAIPLPGPFLAYLKIWLRGGRNTSEPLWPWSRMTGYRRVCEVMDSAGIKGTYASPKGLRHGFGVRAIQSGVPLTLVQRWLGHADIKTTAIYTTAMGPEERQIASRMWCHPPVDGNDYKEVLSKNEGSTQTRVPISTDANSVNSSDPKIIDREESSRTSAILSPRNRETSLVRVSTRLKNSIKSIVCRVGSCSVLHFWLNRIRHGSSSSESC